MQNIKKVHSQKLIGRKLILVKIIIIIIIIVIIIIISSSSSSSITVINLFNVDNQNMQIMRVVKNNYL